MLPTPRQLAHRAAEVLVAAARQAVAARGRFTLALSGGHTPRMLYRILARAGPSALPYHRTHIFWTDERSVPPQDRRSNYRLAWEAWLAQMEVAPGRVHRIRGEDDPDAAARRYEAEIRRVVGRSPRFDLILLGIGPDGHTASIFPGAPPPRGRLVAPATAPVAPRRRVTFTPRLIAGAARVLVLVCGSDKAGVVRRVLSGSAPALPASRLRGPRVLWLLDAAAAARLPARFSQRSRPAATD